MTECLGVGWAGRAGWFWLGGWVGWVGWVDRGVWTGYMAGLAELAACLAWLAGWTLEKNRLVKKRVVESFRLRSHEATLAQIGVQKLC